MAIDLRLAFQSRGQDPRRFVLVAFGGAGPLHAGFLARDLKIPTVLVPPHPGIGSAMGLLQTVVRHVYVQSSVDLLDAFPAARMNELFDRLRARAANDVREEGFDENAVVFTRQLDMRYLHQGYQLAVDRPEGALIEDRKPALKRAFDAAHRRVYGSSAPDEDAEIVTFRLIAEIAVPRLALPPLAEGDGDAGRARKGERPLYGLDRKAFEAAPVYDRGRLLAGDGIDGPAVVEQFDSTTLILAGQRAEVDRYGNLMIESGAAA